MASTPPFFYCDICYIDLNNAKNYENHFNSASHKENINKRELVKQEYINHVLYCSLCLIDCGSPQNLDQHRNGRDHQKKQLIKDTIEHYQALSPLISPMHKSHTIASINQLVSNVNSSSTGRNTLQAVASASSLTLTSLRQRQSSFGMTATLILSFLDSDSAVTKKSRSSSSFNEIKVKSSNSNNNNNESDKDELCNKFKVKFFVYDKQDFKDPNQQQQKQLLDSNNNQTKLDPNHNLIIDGADQKSKLLKQNLDSLYLKLI